jgi:hypothetical protein
MATRWLCCGYGVGWPTTVRFGCWGTFFAAGSGDNDMRSFYCFLGSRGEHDFSCFLDQTWRHGNSDPKSHYNLGLIGFHPDRRAL